MVSSVPPRRMPSSWVITVPSAWRPARSDRHSRLVLRGGGLLVRGELYHPAGYGTASTARRPSPRRCPGWGRRRRSGPGNPRRAERPVKGGAHRHPAHRLHAPSHGHVVLPGDHAGRGEVHRCWEEPHCRSTVTPHGFGPARPEHGVPGDVEGLLADLAQAAQTTSSTTAGSIPVRSASALSTCADRSTGCTPDSPPLRLPTGVRTAATITASRTKPSSRSPGPARGPADVRYRQDITRPSTNI